MIGKLKGKVENIFEDSCLLNVNDVCYIVYCSGRCLKNMSIDDSISLFTQVMLRDEIQILYGFISHSEKDLFMLLTSVQGVGGRMAMNIIGEIEQSQLIQAIHSENPKILQQVSGVGTKIAIRIIHELKSNKKFTYTTLVGIESQYQIKQDVISALLNLGFKRNDVMNVVEKFCKVDSQQNDLENILRSCIAYLSK